MCHCKVFGFCCIISSPHDNNKEQKRSLPARSLSHVGCLFALPLNFEKSWKGMRSMCWLAFSLSLCIQLLGFFPFSCLCILRSCLLELLLRVKPCNNARSILAFQFKGREYRVLSSLFLLCLLRRRGIITSREISHHSRLPFMHALWLERND